MVMPGAKRVHFTGFDERQSSILLGTMLGDGHVSKERGGTNPKIQFSHGLKQREYLIWKASQLKPLFSDKEPSLVRRNSSTDFLVLSSHRHPYLREVRSKFYSRPEDECSKHVLAKKITTEILSEIDDLAFTVWFLDDGFYHRKKCGAGSLGLMLGGVSEAEYDLVEAWLHDHKFSFSRYDRPEKHQVCYEFNTNFAKHLAERMSVYTPHSMLWKLGNI